MKRILFIICYLLLAPGVARALQYGRNVQQAMSLQALAEANMVSAEVISGNLPVRIEDPEIEKQIRSGTYAVTVADLDRCASIWPTGSFAWARANAGQPGSQPTCVAEVYMKMAPPNALPGGANDKVLAVAHVPTGASMKCNISEFPESGYLEAAFDSTVIFPPDKEPTEADVVAVMNKEMKQNAAVKTVAAALVGGAGAFVASGGMDNKGGSKKLAATIGAAAAGAAGMGGLQYASTQSGKVVGETMMGAGMNAATGAVIGNMTAGMIGGGDALLVIKDCEVKDASTKQCLWGTVMTGGDPYPPAPKCYYSPNKKSVLCPKESDADTYEQIFGLSSINVKIKGKEVNAATEDKLFESMEMTVCFDKDNKTRKNPDNSLIDFKGCTDDYWVPISSAKVKATASLAMIKNYEDKAVFGKKLKDFKKEKDDEKVKADQIIRRNPDGTVNTTNPEFDKSITINDFVPMTVGADDGEVIDFRNKARLQGTALGAATGGGLGGLAAYQGAQGEIQDRWQVELDRYEGSLQRFYCVTGARPLGKYNEMFVIPAMK